jgi:ATP-dependent Clp protease ATP-binding subunit ClpA
VLEVTDEALDRLLKEGFTTEYGARELERVLNARITPLLMREILFGRKEGFKAVISATEEGYLLS